MNSFLRTKRRATPQTGNVRYTPKLTEDLQKHQSNACKHVISSGLNRYAALHKRKADNDNDQAAQFRRKSVVRPATCHLTRCDGNFLLPVEGRATLRI